MNLDSREFRHVRELIQSNIPAFEGIRGKDKNGKRIVECGCFFFDSGAHSLYNLHVFNQRDRDRTKRYEWYQGKGKQLFSDEFKAYMDKYAEFIKSQGEGIDYYATVDVIYSPELSWESQKYLEDKHGLKPVPVIHAHTPLKWVERYIKKGHDYIGIGGLGQESSFMTYAKWGDRLFEMLCPGPKHLPIIKTHGFAMTGFELMKRYPWYSVDSTSWAKAAGYGWVYIPHKRNGRFIFDKEIPHFLSFSFRHFRAMSMPGKKHYFSLTANEKKIVHEWLDLIRVPFGEVCEHTGKTFKSGVYNHYGARAIANLIFYQAFVDSLPDWPWEFRRKPKREYFQ